MADKKISQLTGAATPLAGTEVLPIVQSGSTVKVSVSDLTAGRSVLVSGLTAQKATSAGNTTIDITNSAAANTSNKCLVRFSPALDFISYENLAPYVGGYMENAGSLASGLVFGTYTSGSVIERMRISAAGDITASTGNLVIGTAGKGIDFSANGGDVLSQYDEGTYTPVFTASSSNPTVTYGLQRGKYVRVGNTVTVSVFITWSALSGGSGDLQISLPFAGESSVGAGAAGAIADLTGFTFAAGRTFCSVRPNANVLYATFPQSGSAVSTSNTTVAQTASSGLIVFSCTYLI